MVIADGPIYFASDVHWQPAAPDRPEPLGLFGHFLGAVSERARARGGARLFLLGDLFEYWFERDGRAFAFYEPHIAALARARDAGLGLTLLFGNRDFTYARVLPERTGATIAGDSAVVELGAQRVLLEHGDLLCTRDRRYQLFRRFIRSAPVRLAGRAISMERMTGVIERLRRASRTEVQRKAPSALEVVDTAVAARLRRGFDAVICGHVHRPARRRIGDGAHGGELVTLGSWERDEGWYACWDGRELGLHRFARSTGRASPPHSTRSQAPA